MQPLINLKPSYYIKRDGKEQSVPRHELTASEMQALEANLREEAQAASDHYLDFRRYRIQHENRHQGDHRVGQPDDAKARGT